MRLYEKFRPRKLSEIVGQPPVRILQRLAMEPYACCVLLEGPLAVGKTAAAYATAHELGCYSLDTWPKDNPPAYPAFLCSRRRRPTYGRSGKRSRQEPLCRSVPRPEAGTEYSLRSALDAMQDYLDLCCV